MTPDAKAAKKLRVSGDSDPSMEASREKGEPDGGSNGSGTMDMSSHNKTDSTQCGNMPGGNFWR